MSLLFLYYCDSEWIVRNGRELRVGTYRFNIGLIKFIQNSQYTHSADDRVACENSKRIIFWFLFFLLYPSYLFLYLVFLFFYFSFFFFNISSLKIRTFVRKININKIKAKEKEKMFVKKITLKKKAANFKVFVCDWRKKKASLTCANMEFVIYIHKYCNKTMSHYKKR